MKTLKTLRWLGTGIVLLISFTPLCLSQNAARVQAQAQTTVPGDQMIQTFSGKILKSKGDLVLKDSASETVYQLDSGDQMKSYFGKSVKVTGSLDVANKLIHVSNIEVASASD